MKTWLQLCSLPASTHRELCSRVARRKTVCLDFSVQLSMRKTMPP